MLGRWLRKEQAHWIRFTRGVGLIPGGEKCDASAAFSTVLIQNLGSSGGLGTATFGFRGNYRIPSRSLYVDALDATYLDKYFVDYEMREPYTPSVPVPKTTSTLQSHLDEIWKKAAESSYRDIVGALKAWVQEGNIITRDVMNKLLIRLYAQMLYYHGWKLMNWIIVEKPFELTDFDHLVRLDFSVRELKVSKAITSFNRIKQKSETAYVLLLQAFATGHREQRAEAVMKEMKELGIVNICYPYNLMIGMYLRMGLIDQAKKWFAELEQKANVFPDAFTYWILIKSKDRLGIEDLELKIEEFLGDIEGTLTGLEWRNTIRLYGAMGKKLDVERLWREQKRSHFLPESCFLAAIEAFGLLGEMTRVQEIAQQLETQNSKLSERHCFTLVKIYCINGLMVEAEKLVKKMEELGYKLGFKTYHYMVSGYVKRQQFGMAIDKFNEAVEKGMDKGFKHPLFVTVLTLLEAYAQKREVEKAEELVQKVLKTKNYPFDIRLFNSLLKVYYRARKPAWGMEKRIEDANLQPDETTHKLLRKLLPFN